MLSINDNTLTIICVELLPFLWRNVCIIVKCNTGFGEKIEGEDDADTSTDEYLEDSNHDSESEIKDSGSEKIEEKYRTKISFIGKDRLTSWHKNPVKSKFS